MLLAKLSYPRALRPDMEHWFLQDKTRLSRFIRAAMNHVFDRLSYTLAFDYRRLHRDIPQMAYSMAEAIGVPHPEHFRVWGLIDGVFRRIARPKYRCVPVMHLMVVFWCAGSVMVRHHHHRWINLTPSAFLPVNPLQRRQDAFYSGCYGAHGVKFSVCISACGMLEDVAGPYAGPNHDQNMVYLSQLEDRLAMFCSYPEAGDADYFMYGDPAYTHSRFLHAPSHRATATPFERMHNTLMSTARIAVEQAIGSVTAIFPAMDFTRVERMGLEACGKKYLVAVIFRNLYTVIQGHNQISDYFGCSPPTMQEWLADRDDPPPCLVDLNLFVAAYEH